MAKVFGLFGSMTGKLADVVMSVRNGEQIARKYQPVVLNPNTPAQIATRAKLKALSQLSAVVAPVIAIPKRGPVSSRNLFTKKNYGVVSYATNTASIDLLSVQLTDSVVALPNIAATRTEVGISAYLTGVAGLGDVGLDRIVYAAFVRQADNSLRFAGSAIGTDSASGFTGELPPISGPVVIYAYGVRDNTEAARVAFGNLEVTTATTVATLIVSRTLTESDVTLTETRALEVAAANREVDQETETKKRK